MPEIAEVETVRRTLKKGILNKKIKNVNILYPKMIVSNIKTFKDIEGQAIIDILRRGKWLIFELDNNYLLSHLRMEGKYFLKNHDEEINKHEHVIFTFVDGTDLRYHDVRKFGQMILITKDELKTIPQLQKQGLEANDSNLSFSYLKEKFKNKSLPIKSALLDQTIISGLGNIYADEVLFKAKVYPLKKSCDLTNQELDNICLSSIAVANRAIEMGGTTIKSYTSSLGVTGRFQQELMVHTRYQKPCYVCNTPIAKIKVGGRSTYYCPRCQSE